MAENKTINRRQFLNIVAVGGAAGLALKLGWDQLMSDEVVTETRLLMGTIVNLSVVGEKRQARAAVTACLEHMENLEAVLSRFKPDSQLSQLNETGILAQADLHLRSILQQASEISVLSNGAFDITVKPLVDLYQDSFAADGALPASEAVEDALSLVNYQSVEIDAETVRLMTPGAAITLDAIAKGYIVDEGIKVLRDNGFPNVLVEAGGDLAASGTKINAEPWRIGLQAPRQGAESLLGSFDVEDQAVATSGDYMQAYTADFTAHHIIDPRTGYSAPELSSVTVTAPQVALADALATTIMVMGAEQGLQMVEGIAQCEACLVTKDLQTLTSSGFAI